MSGRDNRQILNLIEVGGCPVHATIKRASVTGFAMLLLVVCSAEQTLLAQGSQVVRDDDGSVYMEESPAAGSGSASGQQGSVPDNGGYDNSYDFSNSGNPVKDFQAPAAVPYSQAGRDQDISDPVPDAGDNNPYDGPVKMPLHKASGSSFGPTFYYEYSGTYAPNDAPGFGFTPRGTYYPYVARPLPGRIYVPRMIRPATWVTPNTAGSLYRRSWGPGPLMTGPRVGSVQYPLRPPPYAYGWFRGPANLDKDNQDQTQDQVTEDDSD